MSYCSIFRVRKAIKRIDRVLDFDIAAHVARMLRLGRTADSQLKSQVHFIASWPTAVAARTFRGRIRQTKHAVSIASITNTIHRDRPSFGKRTLFTKRFPLLVCRVSCLWLNLHAFWKAKEWFDECKLLRMLCEHSTRGRMVSSVNAYLDSVD